MKLELKQGNSLEVLKEYPDNHFDSVVTDPPYGLSFMGKKWDYDVPSVEIWKEVLRVLKPGGHLVSFSSSRTYHRMTVNVEDAGFEVRDQLMWLYGSGFPKSHNIGKSQAKKELEVTHEGWGTALKPAHEPIVLARKPLTEKTIVDNVIKWGTGGINIDGSRVAIEGKDDRSAGERTKTFGSTKEPVPGGEANLGYTPSPEGRFPANIIHDGSPEVLKGFPDAGSNWKKNYGAENYKNKQFNSDTTDIGMPGGHYSGNNTYGGETEKSAARFFKTTKYTEQEQGRFPANIIHDGSDEVLDAFPTVQKSTNYTRKKKRDWNAYANEDPTIHETEPTLQTGGRWEPAGSAARFFYCAKVSKKERNAGLDSMPDLEMQSQIGDAIYGGGTGDDTYVRNRIQKNNHPTVKPVALMAYLCKLITPTNGTILDPFMGSGSTGMAAKQEGFSFTGIDLDEAYVEIAQARIDAW